jgi:ethanolamine permease
VTRAKGSHTEMGSNRVSKYHLLSFGLMGVLISTTATWNLGERAGLGFQIVFNVFAAIAFVIFYCCTSELSSALPFPGGNFAFARCTAGFFLGYLVGCVEIFYYLLALAMSNAGIAACIILAVPGAAGHEIYIILALYFSQCLACLSRNIFYNLVLVLTVFGIIINIVFIFGATKHIDFNQWAYSSAHNDDDSPFTVSVIADDDQNESPSVADPTLFVFTGIKVLGAISPCLWVYQGLEYINLVCDDVSEPRSQIPFAQLIGIGIMIIFNTVVPILASSMSPGTHRLTLTAAPSVPGMFLFMCIQSMRY